jgi:hypothetical protein
MSSLPCVAALTRERVAREFDDRGPEVCRTEITLDLEANNPELLDMAARCARDVGNFARVMTWFCMFYRVLSAQARAGFGAPSSDPAEQQLRQQPSLLPRVSAETRAAIVKRIDTVGSHEFTREAVAELEQNNPELLIMSHNFAQDHEDYSGVMQGFALLYASLSAEAAQERGVLH